MTNLRAWWFKPGYNHVRLVRNINEPWNETNGGLICPEELRKRYPGVCLFASGLEKPVKGWLPVTFHNPAAVTENPALEEHNMQTYWVMPYILVEDL
jgi:hypothetical protein